MPISTQDFLAQVPTSKGPAPVHLWNPPFCGDLDIQIKRDGRWIHEGGEIKRAKMVQLFASILKREGEEYFLVTPVEKVGIEVEDVPFVAIDIDVQGTGEAQVLTFTTNIGEQVTAGAENAIRLTAGNEGSVPYVMVRAGLEARLDRKSFYRMIDLGCEQTIDGQAMFGVFSDGVFFPLMPAEEI